MPERNIFGDDPKNPIPPIRNEANPLDALGMNHRDRLARERGLIPGVLPESLKAAGESVRRSHQQAIQREHERHAAQRELVELQRLAAERDRQRDQQDAARALARKAADDLRDATERKRKRRELYRWCFTTAVTLATAAHAFGFDHWLTNHL